MSAIVKIKDTDPRGIVIHPNDTVYVTLTATGADILNELNWTANTGFFLMSTVSFRTDYTEGEVYRDQLHHIMKVFGSGCDLGLILPFTDLWLATDDSEKIL
mgnify:CR=1 FL=1